MTEVDACSQEQPWIQAAFLTASALTDPICKGHELFRRIQVVGALHPESYAVTNLARKCALFMQLVGFALLAVLTTLPGILVRGAAASWQKQPFLYTQGKEPSKPLDSDRSFTLLSWNVCCVAGGYAISNGGVMPWRFRIEAIVDKILKQNADVVCLYETFDTAAAHAIAERLKAKNGYAHCYFNIGPQAVGVSSGILVASKYQVLNPQFTPFPKETLIGRTKAAAKGVFEFDVASEGVAFARIYATHLQHSEKRFSSTAEEAAVARNAVEREVDARNKQMNLIVGKVNAIAASTKALIITGDLNLNDAEYKASTWKEGFTRGPPELLALEGPGYSQGFLSTTSPSYTWGGDHFCATEVAGDPPSEPQNLDHILAKKKSVASIVTYLIPTGYDQMKFCLASTSDHELLLTTTYLHPIDPSAPSPLANRRAAPRVLSGRRGLASTPETT